MGKKYLGAILTLLLLLIYTGNSHAQSADKYVIIVRADECAMCQSNEGRWTDDIISRYKNSDIIFLIYDLTSDNSREASRELLSKYNLFGIMKDNVTNPGGVYVVDAKTITIITNFNMDESTDSVLQTLGSGSPLK